MFGSKGELSGIVVDDVIERRSALHRLSVDVHFFRSCKYDDECLVIASRQPVRTLVPFRYRDSITGKFSFGHGAAGRNPHDGLVFFILAFSELETCRENSALTFFLKIHKITVRSS